MALRNDVSVRNKARLIEATVDMRLRGAQDADELGFMGRVLVQTTLPHSDPGDVRWYERTNGDVSLVIQPGVVRGKGGELRSAGIPYGSYPRLVMAWVTTEAVRTRSSCLVLGPSLSAFMRELGLGVTGGRWGTVTRLRDQMRRLFHARITAVRGDERTDEADSFQISVRRRLWWDPKRPEEPVLFNSHIVLGDEFYHMLVEHPVPIDLRALRALKQSPLGLDLYAWTTYRVSYMKYETVIPWNLLMDQFGADYKNVHDFTKKAKRELKKIALFWPGLKYKTPRGRLVISPCAPHVARLN